MPPLADVDLPGARVVTAVLGTDFEGGLPVGGAPFYPDATGGFIELDMAGFQFAKTLADDDAAAETADAVAVTSGKDAVKLAPDAAVWVVEAEMEPIEGSWRGLWRLLPEVVA